MEFIPGVNRQQMQLSSMENVISQDNIVRFVDAFVDKLDMEKLSFQVLKLQKEGRPAFDCKVLLKLYFYVYLNGIRSTRRLETIIPLVKLLWVGALMPQCEGKHMKKPIKMFDSFKRQTL
jgi:transposase